MSMLIELVGSSGSFPSRPSTEELEEELEDSTSRELNFNVFLLALLTKIIAAKWHVWYSSTRSQTF